MIFFPTKATDFGTVSDLISGKMKKGVITNNFVTPEELRNEIADGCLYYSEAGDGELYILIFRDGFYETFFYTLTGKVSIEKFDRNILIAEVPSKIIYLFEGSYFSISSERIFLEHKDNSQPTAYECAEFATAKDVREISDLLHESFDPRSAFLPSESQLVCDAEMNNIIIKRENGRITGVLRYEVSGNRARIKHVCVESGNRKKGTGSSLVKSFLYENKGRKCSVMTGKENIAAQKMYNNLGFEENPAKTTIILSNT